MTTNASDIEGLEEAIGSAVEAKLAETTTTITALSEKVDGLSSLQGAIDTLSETVKSLSEKNEEGAKTVDGVATDLSEKTDAVKALSDKIDGEIKTLSETLDMTVKELDAERKERADTLALSEITKALDDGKLKPARLPSEWNDNASNAITHLGYASRDAFAVAMADIPANSVVDLSERQSSDSNATGSLSDVTEERLAAVSFKGVSLMDRVRAEELTMAQAQAEYVRLAG